MKAVVLAAGRGTRLRPLTDHLPKCLVTVGGKSLLDHWLDTLATVGVQDVVVNTHHLAPQVWDHVATRAERMPHVRVAHEPTLLGSAGTLAAHAEFLASDEVFLAVNADTLTTFDLGELIAAHQRRRPLATVAVFHASDPTACGVLDVDATGRMVGFEEKPANPRGDLANAGMYAFHADVLAMITSVAPPIDIGNHLLPRLVGSALTVDIGGAFLTDIGTPQALRGAREAWMEVAL